MENENENVITIALYSKIKKIDGSLQYHTGVLSESKNIADILSNTKQTDIIQSPPMVIVSFIFIPDNIQLSELNDPTNEQFIYDAHLAMQTQFLRIIDTFLIPENKQEISRFQYEPYIIKDKPTNEIEFMTDLEATGSFLDIVKTNLIISNKGKSNLHMDSNTVIINWNDLYSSTFNQDTDNYGLSRCSAYYIAFHNKIIYISKDSGLPDILAEQLILFYSKYKNVKSKKTKDINAIYDYVWGETVFLNGSSHKITVSDRNNPGNEFSFYPAAAKESRYNLNEHYLTIQRQSWNPSKTHTSFMDNTIRVEIEDKHNIRHNLEIDNDTFESLFFLYSDIPNIESPSYSNHIFQYEHPSIVDYITFLNKQPNEVNLQIVDLVTKSKIVPEQSCLTDSTFNALSDTSNIIRCTMIKLAEDDSQLVGGSIDDIRKMIEPAYDYEDKGVWIKKGDKSKMKRKNKKRTNKKRNNKKKMNKNVTKKM
jgi:hypothetical protein